MGRPEGSGHHKPSIIRKIFHRDHSRKESKGSITKIEAPPPYADEVPPRVQSLQDEDQSQERRSRSLQSDGDLLTPSPSVPMAIVQSPSPSPSPSTQDENLHREGRSRSVQKDAHLLSPSFAALNLQSSEDEDRKGRSPSPRRDRGLLAPSDAGTTGQSLQGEPLSRGKSRRRSHSRDRRLEPQGLTVIHEPEGERTADIIFVHGLGGSSRTTWSKDGDDDLFWPEKFLASDPGLSSARMLTFGYMAFFGDLKASGNISITDFARDLLGQLKNGPKPAVGQVPIIFVAHSLGGLVVKKAYILGRNKDTFQDIISSIAAMVFLGTPHHGSNLAKNLNKVLGATIIGPSPKHYIADLDENSTAIEDLNEQFRDAPSGLQIASFYETRYTTKGMMKLMVVDKKSSILGCRGEVPQPLDADHHNLCKYDSPDDSNYLKVRNVLESFIAPLVDAGKYSEASQGALRENIVNILKAVAETFIIGFRLKSLGKFNESTDSELKLSSFLAITGPPEDEFSFYYDRWMPGSCSWISKKDSQFTKWISDAMNPQALWIHGPPGSGKSVLATYIINELRALGSFCTYYFFRSGDRVVRNVGAFLRSISFQIAQRFSRYRQQILKMCDAGVQLKKSDPKLLWQQLFLSPLGDLEMSYPIYVVVDALDESDSPQKLLSLLSSISPSLLLRLIVVSRPTHPISSGLDKFPESFPVTRISAESSSQDFPLYVESQLESMTAKDSFKQKITKQIVDRAAGSFLWVHLALKEILKRHTEDEIDQVLQDIPSEMQPLYKRIEDDMTENFHLSDKKSAKAILRWAACSQRLLSLDELSHAVEPKLGKILDLGRTIHETCGNFLVVDRKSRVTFVHQTAREYLMKFSTGDFAIARAEVNEEIFLRCMDCLKDPALRGQLRSSSQLPPLVSYAATSWQFHLSAVSASSEPIFTSLSTLLEDSAVLTWIQVLASQDQLKTLVQASQRLAAFAERRRVNDASLAPNLRPIEALEAMDLWSHDLVKIVGKFGRNLIDMPDSIFKFIPQFCPEDSAIHRQFGRRGAFSVHVPGDANAKWDDSLAKIFVGAESEALSIVCAGRYFAILTSTNIIIIWDADTCQEVRRLHHQDRIMTFCASQDGKMIACYGTRTTRVWDLGTGEEILSISSLSTSRALDAIFTKDDSVLLVSSDDRIIRRLPLDGPKPEWQTINLQEFEDQMIPSGSASISPCSTTFSPDGTQIALAFRGAPLSVWALDDPRLIGRCRRERGDQQTYDARTWSPVDKVVWRPRSTDVLGIYVGGSIFRWNTSEDSSEEVDGAAITLACNLEGDLVASSDANGTVKIWKLNDFVLIYQLIYDYPLIALAFAPDNRRFYDLRGSFCNVWEPNTLIRLSDTERGGSEAASGRANSIAGLSTAMSEVEVEIKEPVTVLAIGPLNHTYITGNAEGSVMLLQKFGDNQTEIWSSPTFMSIEHLTWSNDGKHIALRDLGGKVVVKEVDPTKSSQPPQKPLFDKAIGSNEGPVQQILLSPTSEYILITSPSSAQVFSVSQGSQVAQWQFEDSKTAYRWINHPLHTDQLLAAGATSAQTFNWKDLTSLSIFEFDLQYSLSNSNSASKLEQIRRPSDPGLVLNDEGTVVEHAMYTQDKKHIMLELNHFSSKSKGDRQLIIFPKSAFEEASEPKTITPRELPSALLDRYQLPLGVLPGDRFVFLDNENWICSWQLGVRDESRGFKRYFFLPRDWLNAECLELCRILENGIFLIPRQGEVASIRSDLSLQW